MNEKKEVYCPICEKRGRRKLLLKKHTSAKGEIFVWCRECKAEVKISLDRAVEP